MTLRACALEPFNADKLYRYILCNILSLALQSYINKRLYLGGAFTETYVTQTAEFQR